MAVDGIEHLPINTAPHHVSTHVARPGLDTAGTPRRIQS